RAVPLSRQTNVTESCEMALLSSRRYREYRRQLHQKDAQDSSVGERKRYKTRSFSVLFWEFLGLLGGHSWAIGFALATLTRARLLGLIPPLATKLVVDNVLIDRPLPAWWSEAYGLPSDRYQLLYWIGVAVGVVSLVATIIHLSGRWYATKAVNKLQVAIRRRV